MVSFHLVVDELEVKRTLVNPTRDSFYLMIDCLAGALKGFEAAMNSDRTVKVQFRKLLLEKLKEDLGARDTKHD